MTARTLGAASALAAIALAGCGGNGAKQAPSAAQVPLVPGSHVVARVQSCDRGARAFCAWDLVVVNRHYKSSDALVKAEHRLVHKLGWKGESAETGDENASNSPGRRLRLTYASAFGDLKGIDLGLVRRPLAVAVALSRTMFDRAPAMSVMLELGTS